MKISREEIINIIQEEKRKIMSEGCGCGCNGSPGGCGDSSIDDIQPLDGYSMYDNEHGMEVIHGDDMPMEPDDIEFLSKPEALKSVVAIAMSTKCPVTQGALLDVVQDLMANGMA